MGTKGTPMTDEQKQKMRDGRAAAKTKREQATRETAKAPVVAKAPRTEGEFSSFSTDGDLVDIWERRMLNPNQKPSHPIRIITPGMHLRWINLANTGRYQRARYEEGWVPVGKTELKDEREIYGVSYTTEGYVCRGEKQSEMLMKIPEAVWKKIRARRYAEVEKSNKQIKDNMQSAGAKHFSDKYNNSTGNQMADQFNVPRGQTGAFRGEIKFGTEAVSPESEEATAVIAE